MNRYRFRDEAQLARALTTLLARVGLQHLSPDEIASTIYPPASEEWALLLVARTLHRGSRPLDLAFLSHATGIHTQAVARLFDAAMTSAAEVDAWIARYEAQAREVA